MWVLCCFISCTDFLNMYLTVEMCMRSKSIHSYFQLPPRIKSELKLLAENFNQQIPDRSRFDIKHMSDDKWEKDKNKAISEEKYFDQPNIATMPPLVSAMLFSFFLVLSAFFYSLLFLWKNPLDGFFFTGMLFTTVGCVDTGPKVRNSIDLINDFPSCYSLLVLFLSINNELSR